MIPFMPDVEISEFYPSRPLTETDLTWIIMRILVEKQKAALDMLVAENKVNLLSSNLTVT